MCNLILTVKFKIPVCTSMTDNIIKDCSVLLKPCTPKLKSCYVSLQQCAVIPVNRKICENTFNTEIHTPKFTNNTEPCTPNIEPQLATELRRAITEKNILTTKTKSKFISALSELEKANSESNRQHRKEKAMKEVIDSEITYLKQLKNIIIYFKEPLASKYILSSEEIEKIFSTVTMLYSINKELLEIVNEEPINIAQAFKKVAPFFKLYSTYAYEYKALCEFLQGLENKNEEFSKFVKCQETRPEVQMKLSSLLITPIQRIPRYCLLLKQILLHTLEGEDDYQTLKDSLKIVEESARHIDSLVEERENSDRLLTIQNSLVNSSPVIIKAGRKLIKAGKVLKMTNTNGNIMYLVLMTDILMFCKIKKDNIKSKNALKCSFILPLNKCKFSENSNLRKIHISCEDDDTDIFIEKVKEFDQWIHVLKESLKDIINNRHTLRKESSSRRPAYKNDLKKYDEIGLSPGKRQRKRKLATTFSKLNHNITGNKQNRPSQLVLKRKCIRDLRRENTNNVNDSLYPLRSHYLPKMMEVTDTNKEITKVADDDPEKVNDVFVFGNPNNQNRGFNFGICNFFTHLGHSLRRLFRLK